MNHLRLITNSQERQEFENDRNTCSENTVKPLVGYVPETEEVLFDLCILPENKWLWEKFKLIYGEYVTCEDFMLFATQPMTSGVSYGTDGINNFSAIEFWTYIEPCLGDQPNPLFRLTGFDSEEYIPNATIDDFVGLGGEHTWCSNNDCNAGGIK